MRFLEVTLRTARPRELIDFYAGRLGMPRDDETLVVGETRIRFVAADGEPFYHFALLVPGNRFHKALAWAAERVPLLPGGDIDEVVFDFDNWSALACYFHDPAGNIVELIALLGIDESDRDGRFAAAELVGLSELGVVGDVPAMAGELTRLDLHVWDGEPNEPGRLAFVGEKGRTLILAPERRGWLPTRRPAEPHPVEAVVSGPPPGEIVVAGHRIIRR